MIRTIHRWMHVPAWMLVVAFSAPALYAQGGKLQSGPTIDCAGATASARGARAPSRQLVDSLFACRAQRVELLGALLRNPAVSSDALLAIQTRFEQVPTTDLIRELGRIAADAGRINSRLAALGILASIASPSIVVRPDSARSVGIDGTGKPIFTLATRVHTSQPASAALVTAATNEIRQLTSASHPFVRLGAETVLLEISRLQTSR